MQHAWERSPYRALVGKPEGKRPPGRPRRKWGHNINIYIGELGLMMDTSGGLL
jgi:hypothetical protein